MLTLYLKSYLMAHLVLIISPDPRIPGGQTVFIETLKEHVKETHVLTLHVGHLPGQKENVWDTLKRLVKIPYEAVRLVRTQKIDVVHMNPVFNAKSLLREGLILLALRMAGFRRVMIYFHGWQMELARKIKRNIFLRAIFCGLLNGTSVVMVLSPEFKKALIDIGIDEDKITVTRTMFDGRNLSAATAVQNTRTTILFMSRFVMSKGIYQLMDAFAALALQYPEVDLVFAGDGEEKDMLEARAAGYRLQNRISFSGYVSGPAKAALLRQCSIFALPTYYPEGMPVALLEAMAAGKVLLTSSAGGICHIISDPQNGVVLDDVSVDSVEAGLRRLLDDPDLCRVAGRRNEAYAWKNFEACSVTAEIEALYRDIAAA